MAIKKALVLLFLTLFLFTIGGCSSSVREENGNDGSKTITITDVLGRTVTVEKEPERIVSLSPAVTEILFELKLGDKVVGVTDYCDYPPEALDKPRVGGFENPNLEIVVNLEPDLVFTSAGVQEKILKRLEEAGITAVALDAENIEGVLENIELVGKITHNSKIASEVVEELTERIKTVEKKVQTVEERPKVFFEVWDDPLMSAGPGSFIHDLIKRAGGRNVAADSDERYPQFSPEVLLQKNPDVYIINSHAHTPKDIKAREGYQTLNAVKNDRVYSIEDDLVTLPGPRIVRGLEEMARIIHPELFQEEL